MNRVRKIVEANYAYEREIYGQGIGVAILDSGIYSEHPDLKHRILHGHNFYRQEDSSLDLCGHGTHVAGIVGGTGVASSGKQYQGLAPRCHFVSLQVLDKKGMGNSQHLMEALGWILVYGKSYGVRIVNISIGGNIKDNDREELLLQTVEDVWNAGFVVCVAAGNQGPEKHSITVPGTSPKVITVGTSDHQKKVNYSGRGPTADCICKPEVVAPGSMITSCDYKRRRNGSWTYTKKSGTSMSTPVVSGCIALLLSAYPYLTNKEVKMQLKNSCRDLGLPKNQQGWGEIYVPELLKLKI